MSFEVITSGPSGPSGQNPQATPNGLAFDKLNSLLAVVGISGLEKLLTTIVTTFQEQAALNAITTAQVLLTQPLPAWMLNRLGRNLKIRGRGLYTSPGTTAPVVTLAVLLGATTLVSITLPALSTTASANMPFEFEFDLSVAAAGAADAAEIEAHGKVTANITANTPHAACAVFLDENIAPVAAVNLESALALEVTIASTLTVTSAKLLWATIEASGN